MTKHASIGYSKRRGVYEVRDRSHRLLASCATFDEAWAVSREYLYGTPRRDTGQPEAAPGV
jgi:hypothetical protein